MANATPQKPTTLAPIDEVRDTLSDLEGQFRKALPPQMPSAKFVRIAQTAVQKDANLLTTDRKSLYGAFMMCAQDGLLPDGREAAITIFAGKAVYMPMVAGIMKKVRNSGELASITSEVVYKNDKFSRVIDENGEHLHHEPLSFGERGEPIGVYAQAKTKDGAIYVEVLDVAQINAIKAMARSKNVWEGPFAGEMWRKSAIRRLSKRLPMSTDLEAVITRDDEMYDLTQQGSPVAAAPTTTPKRMKKLIEGQVVKPAAANADAPPPEIIDQQEPDGEAQESPI